MRNGARHGPGRAFSEVWRWWSNADGWESFADVDAELLEKAPDSFQLCYASCKSNLRAAQAYAAGETPFSTKQLSRRLRKVHGSQNIQHASCDVRAGWNAGYDSLYIFDFTVMTQAEWLDSSLVATAWPLSAFCRWTQLTTVLSSARCVACDALGVE